MERNGTWHDSSGGEKKRGRLGSCRIGSGRVGSGRVGSGRVGSGRVGSGRAGSGRVGSGRVGWTLFFTRLDPNLTFFHPAVTIAPFIGHFVLPASNRLCCHSISYQKMLWCRIQLTSTNIFFESVMEILIRKEQSRQNECNHLLYTWQL